MKTRSPSQANLPGDPLNEGRWAVEEKRRKYEPRGRRRSALPIVLVAIVVLAGIGGGVFLLAPREAPPVAEPEQEVATSEDREPPVEPADPAESTAPEEPPRTWRIETAFALGGRSKVELPSSSTGILPTDKNRAVEVGVEADSTLWIAGKQVGLDSLRERLFIQADLSRAWDHPSQPSNTPAVITADGRVRWRTVQYVMQACADPAVRIWKIHFAVTTPDGEGTLDVPLPRDRGIMSREMQPEEKPKFKVELKRIRGEQVTRVELMGQRLGTDDFDRLARLLEGMVEEFPDATVELHAWAAVPFHHVVLALDQIRGVGIKEITFIGAPASTKDILREPSAGGK